MTPYLLIFTGGLALISGIVMLIRQNATATSLTVPALTHEQSLSTTDNSDEQPTNYEKGFEFEKWVYSRASNWKSLEWQGDKMHEGRYPTSNHNPDMLFAVGNGSSKQLIALECKWKNGYSQNEQIEWASEKQIANYNRYSKEKNALAFAIIGIGGKPSTPEDLYIVPLSSLKYSKASKEYLARFKYPAIDGNFYFDFPTKQVSLRP